MTGRASGPKRVAVRISSNGKGRRRLHPGSTSALNGKGRTFGSGGGVMTDPVQSALAAGLRYVSDSSPGISRRRAGKGFIYIDPTGKRVRDSETRNRIRRLAIPPAWSDVWICPDPSGHLQAVGRDARRRKQYRYHPGWREVRDETKYWRMVPFARALPRLRRRIEKDLALAGLPREKVIAAVVQLLEATLIRVGNEEYARHNDSFGLTTLRDRHVDISGSTLRFEFRGKSGVRHSVDLKDRRLARIVKDCQDLPGYELFQYVDASGSRSSVGSSDVNAYLRDITGEDFTAKDFRTWAGTVLAAEALARFPACESVTQARKNVARAVQEVAVRLGNTRAVCRKCYIHPALIEEYGSSGNGALTSNGGAIRGASGNGSKRRSRTGLSPEEKAVLEFLEKHAAAEKRRHRSLRARQAGAGVPEAWRVAGGKAKGVRRRLGGAGGK